ncbi:kinase-like domain-containing protein [Xylaria scruposa]|nr:kinase-like domain-containing protein [Xylaria scruposa]
MFLPKETAPPLHSPPPSSPEPLLSGFSSPRLSLPKCLRAIFSRLLCLPSESPLKTSPETSLPNNSRPEVSQKFPQPVLITLPPPPVPLPLPESPPHILSSPSEAHDAHPRSEDSSPLQPWKPRMDPGVISKQFGAEVRLDDGEILKRGNRVRKNEEEAIRIVKQYTTIPVPEIYDSEYKTIENYTWGQIWMEKLPGSPLNEIWNDLDDATKERVCHELWGFVEQLRNIPKPSELEHLYQCGVDGSACHDVLLEDLGRPRAPILDDESLRRRINELYLHSGGASYRENLPDYLPRSNISVFTHADLAPRNVLVDESGIITGLIDWEFAGWYPDYWEYAKTQTQWGEEDYMHWMDRTKPQSWDITGIHKAKRILF